MSIISGLTWAQAPRTSPGSSPGLLGRLGEGGVEEGEDERWGGRGVEGGGGLGEDGG